jgi:hypothetical protein
MPAGPQAWRHWRRGTPRNGKPNCANDPKGYGYRTPPPSAPAPAAAEQRHAPIIFLCEDDEDDANETSPTIQFISPKGDTNES